MRIPNEDRSPVYRLEVGRFCLGSLLLEIYSDSLLDCINLYSRVEESPVGVRLAIGTYEVNGNYYLILILLLVRKHGVNLPRTYSFPDPSPLLLR